MNDIEDDMSIFFKHFNITPIQPTLDMKELLEEYWCHSYYEDEPIEYMGKTYENWGNFEINYSADQWWSCDLFKYTKGDPDLYCYKRICHGEGSSPLYALMAMTIDGDDKGLISLEDKKHIKSIFQGKQGYEYDID